MSKLTSSYFFFSWDSTYEKELEAFKDIGDVGEIW